MQNISSGATLLLLICSLALVGFLNAQSCTSFFASDDNIALYGKTGNKCLIGSVFNSNSCKKISDIFTQKRGTQCSKSSDCILSVMACRNGICVSEARYTGDNCISDSECVLTGSMPSVCYAGKCRVMTVEQTLPVGGVCFKQTNNYTISTCVADSTCYNSVCMATNTKTAVGANCSMIEDGKLSVCGSGLICSTNQCVATLNIGETCTSDKTCVGICRKTSASAVASTCQSKLAAAGEYCVSDNECGPSGVKLMMCRNNQCVRRNSVLNGKTCSANDECFSGYCNNTVCASISKSCKVSTDCVPSYNTVNEMSLEVDYCLCPGSNITSTSSGSCMKTTCEGFRINFDACLWNQYGLVRPFKLTNDKRTFIDTESTLFKGKCARQLAQYYKCMNQNFADANYVVTSSFQGLDMDVDIVPYVEQVQLTPIQPASSVNSGSFNFISAIALAVFVASMLILH
ncbi:predicted protein [Naegleria gruberi]|uniref:Predicted protein n=1 Tax=Naegleria gruberi TaxID=5762 RepID=D2V7X7_NAEGR|nr:uncharacterized protein NAEGRDRAFT_64958 [Naegleria gruberi]EFC47085.1 predicted protein [Naegleria gruberi]|eukprot:XP_002679829.1 predicted protein [Naegleria gruberi strain NEG-M]